MSYDYILGLELLFCCTGISSKESYVLLWLLLLWLPHSSLVSILFVCSNSASCCLWCGQFTIWYCHFMWYCSTSIQGNLFSSIRYTHICLIVYLQPRIDVRIMGMYQSRKTVFTITANAIAVLIVTLINFILFVIDKDGFFHWCITSSASYVTEVYDQMNSNSTKVPPITLENGSDLYNCERLYENEVKWAFLCFVVMSIVYVSFISLYVLWLTQCRFTGYSSLQQGQPINSSIVSIYHNRQ